MKILQLLMHDNSGAGKAALRLHHGLLQNKIDSLVMASHRSLDIPGFVRSTKWQKLYKTIQPLVVDRFTSQRVSSPDDTFSINITPSLLNKDIGTVAPSLINLHWVGWEFLKIEDFQKIKVPLVWTLHDMWAFTGGCHYSGNCDRYQTSCGNCPQLVSNREADLSRWVWQRKLKAWKDLNLTIVAPSNWLAACAKNSALFKDLRIETIPNGLDIRRYHPIDKQHAKKMLGLPVDKQIILFGAISATSATRKGFQFLKPALQQLSQNQNSESIELVIFGSSAPLNPPDLGFKVNYLGRLNDDISLALVYAAADVFIAPSVEDNLPNTVMEALACGTPCVSFKIGGMSDLIDSAQTGYLAQPFDIDDLARGITWVLADRDRHQQLCIAARQKVEREFSAELQARRYTALYQELVI